MRVCTPVFAALVLAGCQTYQWDGTGLFPQRYTEPSARYAVAAGSKILIVYIGADDCPPCWQYKADDYPDWVASDAYRQVTYREVQFANFQDTSDDAVWPDDLEWLKQATYTSRGAPRWIVLVDGRIISNEKSWNLVTYPLIRRLVEEKRLG